MMPEFVFKDTEYTETLLDHVFEVIYQDGFMENDHEMIYESLCRVFPYVSFAHGLKRWIYEKSDILQQEDFENVTAEDYAKILNAAFDATYTQPSFTSKLTKREEAINRWLSEDTVQRETVFLLGFALQMSVEQVNDFLTKYIREQRMNSKNPMEVICWYCYKNQYNFSKYQLLWNQYLSTPSAAPEEIINVSDRTGSIWTGIEKTIRTEDDLMRYLSRLPRDNGRLKYSVTAREKFDQLYDDAKKVVLEWKQKKSKRKIYTLDDVRPSDYVNMLFDSIPRTKNNNRATRKNAELNRFISGKRLDSQSFSRLLNGTKRVSRYDLINLNIFNFLDESDSAEPNWERHDAFVESTNAILEECGMSKLYLGNPYDCLVELCMFTYSPELTFVSVWDDAYGKDKC